MAQRNYHVGDVRFLYLGSGGFCYFPKCAAPVLREIEGEMISQVEIAHIHALDKNGPRHEESMTLEQLNSHKNLILLCIPHHKIVDRMSNVSKYPTSRLNQWKQKREGASLDALQGIAHLTQDQFEHMLINSVTSAKGELLEAIDALPDRIDARIIKTLRDLVDQSFKQPKLDIDAVGVLSNAIDKLDRIGLPDTVDKFNGVVDRFEVAASKLPPQ